MVQLTTLFLALAGASLSVVSAQISGMTIQIIDSENFCTFMPPPNVTDVNISDNEWDAVAYCTGSDPEAIGALPMPEGFILSANFESTSAYIQITGQIDPTKAGLNVSDEGGQFDVMSPAGATCAGWLYFVNLIEPAGDDYCIRCCNDTTNCNRGISQDGCAKIIPGNYSGPIGNGYTIGESTTTSSAAASATVSLNVTSSVPSSSSSSSSNSAVSTPSGVTVQSVNAAGALKPFGFAAIAMIVGAFAFNF